MKKKLLKIFVLLFCVGLFLTGCATVTNVQDGNGNLIAFDVPVYFQGQVAKVGDYLYYGNAYVDVSADSFNYATATTTSYLARLNLSSLSFDDEVLEDNYSHTSPEGIEKVNVAKVAGYANQEMFAYGQYLYFTSANLHKTNTMQNDYSRVSLFRVLFNGDGLQEIGTFTYDEKSSISLTQGSDGNYYFVVICPTEVAGEEETSTYDVYSLKAGDALGGLTKVASKVNTAFVADEFSTKKTVVYTYGTESERLPNAIASVDYATGDVETYDSSISEAVALVGREGDIAFYSYKKEIYYKDLTNVGVFTPSVNQLFYSAESISNIEKVGDGYMFVGASSLMYKSSLSATATALTATSNYTDILFVDGDYIYLSNDTSIMRISKFGGEIEKLVEEMKIISGECGYVDGNVYFYAQRGTLVDEKGETITPEETDENYYLYQADKYGNIQLIGQAK